MAVQDILEEVRALSLEERKQLMKLIVDTLTEPVETPKKSRRLQDLRGLGKEIWAGVDAQEYINQQREEWLP
jgi:ClpP class serine protease